MVNRKTREELNTLSKEVFGSSSRWQKLVNKGYSEIITQEVTELVPSDKPGEDAKVETVNLPVKRSDGAIQSVTKYHTVDSVRNTMLDLKKRREEFMAQMKQIQEEQKAAEERSKLEQAIESQVSGSAST